MALSNRGRVVHGYPATRGHEDALALLRREVDAGTAPTGRTLEALQEANAAALDALARVVGDSLDFCWLPGVEEGEARRMMGRAMVESMTADNPTIEVVRRGSAPSRLDRLRAAFDEGERLAATMTEAEKETDRRINPVPWYRGQNRRKSEEPAR